VNLPGGLLQRKGEEASIHAHAVGRKKRGGVANPGLGREGSGAQGEKEKNVLGKRYRTLEESELVRPSSGGAL